MAAGIARQGAEELLKKWLAPAVVGGAAATQSEDADAIFAGLLAKGANKAGAKAAHDVFKEHMEIDPRIFTNFDDLIESGRHQMHASRDAGSKNQSWFIGADGKPRYEINDSNASVTGDFNKGVARALNAKIEEGSSGGGRQYLEVPMRALMNHDPLYNAYPQLADTPLLLWKRDSDFLGDTPAAYSSPRSGDDPEMGFVHLNLGPVIDEERNETLRSLLHEVQHGIQHKEGLARGASGATAIDDARAYFRKPTKHGGVPNLPVHGDNRWKYHENLFEPKMDQIGKLLDASDGIDSMDAPDDIKEAHRYATDRLGYLFSAGEAEARAVEKRLRQSAMERRYPENHPYNDMRMPREDAELYFGDGKQGPTLFQMIEMLTRETP
jgi:hypothetical protein